MAHGLALGSLRLVTEQNLTIALAGEEAPSRLIGTQRRIHHLPETVLRKLEPRIESSFDRSVDVRHDNRLTILPRVEGRLGTASRPKVILIGDIQTPLPAHQPRHFLHL
jgi:hypothetical protein